MSVISVYVPVCGNDSERVGWVSNISQHIDSGNDVEFFDANDHSKKTFISILNLTADGNVAVWGAHETISEAKTLTLDNGFMHVVPGVHGIRADDTDSSLGIKVKI